MSYASRDLVIGCRAFVWSNACICCAHGKYPGHYAHTGASVNHPRSHRRRTGAYQNSNSNLRTRLAQNRLGPTIMHPPKVHIQRTLQPQSPPPVVGEPDGRPRLELGGAGGVLLLGDYPARDRHAHVVDEGVVSLYNAVSERRTRRT